MSESVGPDFAAANEEREKRATQAVLDFDWGNYRLHEVQELAWGVQEDLKEDGESDRIDWARDLAKAVLAAGRPVSPGEMSQ